jgi:hypothetical protein
MLSPVEAALMTVVRLGYVGCTGAKVAVVCEKFIPEGVFYPRFLIVSEDGLHFVLLEEG